MGRDTLFASATAGDSDAKLMTADYRLDIDDDGTKVEASAFPGDDDIEFHELLAKAEGIDDICTILHSESMSGNAERVRFIVRAYADKNILGKLDSNKETALDVAANCGHADVVEVLIDAARSGLPTSAHDDQITCFEDFIRHPNYDSVISMNTALHLAVSNGDMAIAKLLIEADPGDTHIQNTKGETPIYLAAKLGYNHMVKMICETCTAPGLAGPHGTTALHAAILMLTEGKDEGLSVVEAIIDAAKSSASSTNRSYNSVRNFLRRCNKKDKDTALHLAVRRNHLGVAKHIIEADPSLLIINKQSDFKSTIYKAAEQGYMAMVALLCDPYEAQNNVVHRGQSALCAAIIGRDTESVISTLRKANHPVNYVDDIGWTPLHYAACYKFDSVLKIIATAQASAEYEVVYEKKIPTPLCVAAKEGHTSTLTRLMELLPDSCIVANSEGQNILHLAAIQNNKKMVQRILRYCPHKYIERILNGQDINGNTPLHLLISQGCFIRGIMDTKKWPVDMMARNNKNWTPADMLYFQEEVIGEQLNFVRVDDTPATTQQRWKFWRRSSTRESSMPLTSMERSSTRQSLVPLSERTRKDVKFKMVKKELIKKYAERSRQMADTQVVISALITTITFTVGFTMPGGLHQSGETDQGFTVLSKKTAFKTFMVSDAFAFFLSSYSLFQYYFEPYNENVSSIMLTSMTKTLNLISIIAMLITFISGTYVVLSHSPPLANTVVTIGAVFFLQIILKMINFVLDGKDEEIDQA